MEAQQVEEELLEPAPIPVTKLPNVRLEDALPSVPTGAPTRPPKAKTQEELELEELEKELAI
jgi:charged multivesicular body protein 4